MGLIVNFEVTIGKKICLFVMLATLKKHEEEKFLVFQEVRGRALLNKHTQNRSTDEPKKKNIYIYIQMQEPMNVERNMYVHESS
jgi:hypothetical protein